MAKLDVLVITYNHAPYIGKCLDSILSQNTSHDIRIVVIEDCSTDGTQGVLKDYIARYPHLIEAHLNQTNRGRSEGIQPQVYSGLTRLGGDYTALMEGDDYWSDDSKVERQIDFLENNPAYAACAHNTIRLVDDGSEHSSYFGYRGEKDVHQIADLISMTSYFHITAMIYRNVFRQKSAPSYLRVSNNWCCEIYINMLFCQYGPLKYIDRDMSVYRIHSGGNFSGMSAIKGRIFNIEGLIRYNHWLHYRFLKYFAFTLYRLTREMLTLSGRGILPKLSLFQNFRYRAINLICAITYDTIDRFPTLDPAVIFFKDPHKASNPRQREIAGYDRATENMIRAATQNST